MAAKTAKKRAVGKRYSSEEKAKVVDFVNDYNRKNGRGGQSKASKEFKVSQLTISTWLKAHSGGSHGSGRTSKYSKRNSSADIDQTLSRLSTLSKELAILEKDLDEKRDEFEGLKASL